MIASWMLYALAISALMTVGALAAERVAARAGATRFVWGAALALSLAWPLGSTVRRLLPAPARAVSVLPFTIVVQAPSPNPEDEAAAARALLIDRALMGVWCVLSALLLLRIARGVYALERVRGAWKRGRVDGMRVQLSDNVGPAVIGLRSMDVVLPEWILSLDEPLRAMVLRHEEEHRLARDPYLLFASAIAVALMPWNPALWIQARRLRLAIEMDCDARVLRAHPSPERYGMLMLTIAQRRSAAPAMFAPMLSEPTTNLERRILAMRTNTRKLARVSMYGGSLVVIAVLAFASSLQSAGTSFPTPRLPFPKAAEPVAATLPETIPVKRKATIAGDTVIFKQMNESPQRLKEVMAGNALVPGNPMPRYPEILRAAEIEGMVVARFSSDANGVVDSSSIRIVSSTHDLLSAAVLKVLPMWKLVPNTTTQTPFIFNLVNKTGAEMADSRRGWPAGSVVITAAPAPVQGAAPLPVSDKQTFFEFQIEVPAKPVEGTVSPRYPDMLRSANVEGEVLAQFVVDADGRPIPETFKVLKSSHELFTQSVKSSLPNMQFTPALVGGKAVKQLIQMPFHFDLPKQP